MSEQEKQPDNSQKNKFPKKPGMPRSPFNFYWIYGIIAVALIVVQLVYSSASVKEVSRNEFLENMLKQHHVVKIIAVPGEYMAEITIGKEYFKLPQYSSDKLENHPNGPHYKIKITDTQSLNEMLNEAEKDFAPSERIYAEVENRTSWTEALGWVIPIALMIVIWIVIMRRMGGGAGGGQIFNIGKSKATLFDKNTNVNITFNDVAGLEGAK